MFLTDFIPSWLDNLKVFLFVSSEICKIKNKQNIYEEQRWAGFLRFFTIKLTDFSMNILPVQKASSNKQREKQALILLSQLVI